MESDRVAWMSTNRPCEARRLAPATPQLVLAPAGTTASTAVIAAAAAIEATSRSAPIDTLSPAERPLRYGEGPCFFNGSTRFGDPISGRCEGEGGAPTRGVRLLRRP